MAKWYVKRNNMQVGPFETAQLKQLAADGKIKPADLIRREDQTSWSNASDVKGLIAGSSVQPTASPALQATDEPNRNTPPPLPIKTHSLSITEAQITLARVLLYAIFGSLIVISFCPSTVLIDEEGLPTISVGFALSTILSPIYIIADTVLLVMSWRALPPSKRPFKLQPAVIVAMTFIPFIGYVAYFFAYGALGAAWCTEGTEARAKMDQKRLESLRWVGYLLAGWLGFLWVMYWLSEIAFFAEFDMSWWSNPMAEGKRRARFLERWLSPNGLMTIFLALWYHGFYSSQIILWNHLRGKSQDNSVLSSQ
jgi:hypothetical protein